jgi:hypothetical protein
MQRIEQMTATIIKLPCAHEGYYLARMTLRRADATPEQIAAALDVLHHSDDWMDMQLCRNMRWAETRCLSDAELIAGGADIVRPEPPPIDWTIAGAWGVILAGGILMTIWGAMALLQGVGI